MANQEEVRDVYGYFEQKGNALCYRYEAERVRIEPWGADSLRVRAWKTAEMDPADWALIKPEKEITPEIEVREDGATIRNGKIRAEINLIGKIAFYNQKGELLLDEYVRNRKDMFGNTCSSLEVEAREFKPITGGDYRLTMRFVSTPEEKIYGMGQYQQPYLMSELGPEHVIITSAPGSNAKNVATLAYNRLDHRTWRVLCDYIPASYPGTGDAFASVITGCMLNGDSLPEALDRAVHFINMGIKATFGYTHNPLDGMNQEKVLHYLNEPLPYYKYELVEN